MNKESIISALRVGAMRVEGQFIYGSNYTFFATCTNEEVVYKVVYKPMDGERPLWDFPTKTLAKREVAAYHVSEALGWNLVPPTIFRISKAPLGAGSVQLFIAHDPDFHYFKFGKEEQKILPKVMAFDHLINNADRKGGHFLLDDHKKIWLIDHGLSFHVDDKLRTVVWDYAGKPIPGEIIKDIEALKANLINRGDLYRSLIRYLSTEEVEALNNRANNLINHGTYPLPPEERRAYPWPLV